MKILIACEESQEVCKAYRAKGHEAYSCDVQECSGGHPEWHIQGDALKIINPEWYDGRWGITPSISFETMDGEYHQFDGKWDMIIAFPPCTYLSNAGACRLYPKKGQLDMERYRKGLEAKEFFLKFLNADCNRIAVENPVSSTVFQMPKHSQEIQPYMFGHPYTKKPGCGCVGFPNWWQRISWSLSAPMSPPERAGKIGANTAPQSGARMQRTERKPSPESPVLWLTNGAKNKGESTYVQSNFNSFSRNPHGLRR